MEWQLVQVTPSASKSRLTGLPVVRAPVKSAVAAGSCGANCGTLVTGDEVLGNGAGPVGTTTSITGIAVDPLGQAYLAGSVSLANPGKSYIIDRRLNANNFIVGGTPFLTDVNTTDTTQTNAITAVGDINLINPAAAALPVGASNGISFDPSSNNVCIAGFINQPNLPSTVDTTPILAPSAFEPSTALPSLTTAGVSTGILACRLYNADTFITVNGTPTVAPSFSFTMPDGGNAPSSQTLTVSNNFLSADFSVSAITYVVPSFTGADPHDWLTVTKNSSDLATMSINNSAVNGAGTFDPGLYTATFLITPLVGDNVGVPTLVNVSLSITGVLSVDGSGGGGPSVGGGIAMSTVNDNSVTCVDATLTCTLNLSANHLGPIFPDGNTTETIQIPVVSIVQLFNPSPGNIHFTTTEGTGAGSLNFITANGGSVSTTAAGPNAGGCHATPLATPNACYVTVNIPAAAFTLAGSYTDTLTFSANGPAIFPNAGGASPVAPQSSSQIPSSKITFTVNVTGGILIYTGNTSFASPTGAAGNVLLTSPQVLDSVNIGTTQATSAQGILTPASPSNPITCPVTGGPSLTATQAIPPNILTINLNVPLPPANAGAEPATQTPFLMQISNPGTLAAGTYADTIVFQPSDTPGGPLNPSQASVTKNICLTVGNQMLSTLNTSEAFPGGLQTGMPGGNPVPFVIEAGSSFGGPTFGHENSLHNFGSLANVTVNAVGPVFAGAIAAGVGPPSVLSTPGIPVSVGLTSTTCMTGGTPWVTLNGPNSNSGAGNPLAFVDWINIAPPLVTPQGHCSATFSVTATGSGATAGVPTPQSLVLDINVTQGLGLFFYDSQALDNNGNPVSVDSPVIPGAPAAEAAGPQSPITLNFTSVLGSGTVTDAFGNNSGWVSVLADQDRADITPSPSLLYSYGPGAVPFLLPNIFPDGEPGFICFGGGGDIDPINSCTLNIGPFNAGQVASLPLGTYTASFTANFVNPDISNVPTPTPLNVNIVLQVTNYPTVTVNPGSLTYTLTQGPNSSAPARVLALSTNGTAVPFTATPSGTGVLLNGGTAAISGFVTGTTVTTTGGNPLTLTVTVSPTGLTQLGSPYTGGVAFSFGSVSVPVADPSVNVPIVINVLPTPGLTICAGQTNCGTYDWTVGDPNAFPTAATAVNVTLIGSDTFNVTSNQPWAVVVPTPPQAFSAASASVTVGLNLALAPTAPGTYTATITATGVSGSEPPASTTITLIVTGPPSLTVGTGAPVTMTNPGTQGAAGQNVSYNYGSANPAPLSIPVSIAPVGSATVEALTSPVTCGAVSYPAGSPTGWASVTTCPASVTNNAGGTAVVVTLTPNTTSPPVPPGTYTASFLVTATDGAVPNTYTASVLYTVTLNVVGSLTDTTPNGTTFAYEIGTSSIQLPINLASLPVGVNFTVNTTSNLSASITTGTTTASTPPVEITVNTATVTTPGPQTGTITIGVPNSSLNCPPAQVSGATCQVVVSFTINAHHQYTPLSVGNGTGIVGTAGSAATPGTGGQTVTYNYLTVPVNPAALSIPISVTPGSENQTIALTYSAISYTGGPTGWATLISPPASVNNSGAALSVGINVSTPVITPGTYTATFTVSGTDGGVYNSAVTYTVTLNVVGNLFITAANTTFTYEIGTTSMTLPVNLSSLPTGTAFTVTTSGNLLSSVSSGTTPSTPNISVNTATVTTAGTAIPASVSVSVPNTVLNCPAALVVGPNCVATLAFTINAHHQYTPLTVGNGSGAVGAANAVAVPGTGGQTVTYAYGSSQTTPLNIPISIGNTTENTSIALSYSGITYSAGASNWANLATAPSSVNNSGTTLVVGLYNPATTNIAPGIYTAKFTVSGTDGGVYNSAVTYTITLSVQGSLSVTAANTTFTYVVGTASGVLPINITSVPAGLAFTITTDSDLAPSLTSGTTPNSPPIAVNGNAITAAGVLTGNVTVSILASILNCASPVTVNNQSVCTATIPFTINVHSSFFQGETVVGGGFYNLPFFGEYAYFPGNTAIYHTTLGEELIFPNTDSSRGIYFYDQDSGHIWYTNPATYPYIYDFNLNAWLFYFTNSGNGKVGTRSFYNFATGKFIFL